jgi:ring-1,2-phenylacetyl-CoA epoxidase subunit PaaD
MTSGAAFHDAALQAASADAVSGTAATGRGDEQRVWDVLGQVMDPEIPILSIVDLGVVRHVRWPDGPGSPLHVGLTPTYSGCPATEVIRQSVLSALHEHGYAGAVIDEVLAPPWSSDWLSADGRRKLQEFGISPPEQPVARVRSLVGRGTVCCPRCASARTERVSEFGSTPCKAHYRCLACLEPFDHFKCI